MKQIKQTCEVPFFAAESIDLITMVPMMNYLTKLVNYKRDLDAYNAVADGYKTYRRPEAPLIEELTLSAEFILQTMQKYGYCAAPNIQLRDAQLEER